MLQKLEPGQITVHNIDGDKFNDAGVLVHPQLTIETSALGGTGIFINVNNRVIKEAQAGDIIIAHIPQSITFDLPRLLSRQEALKVVNMSEWEIIKQVLSNCGGINETEVLIDYFFSFMIIITNQHHKQHCPIKEIEFYLDILSQTNVESLQFNDHDYLFYSERSKVEQLKQKYRLINQSLQNLNCIIPTFDEYYHINKVIKSRVLEIPQAVDENSEDFTVNTTLVPLLDFVNHQYNNNAYFDVDRSTGDILLKLDSTKLHDVTGKIEVSIQYSDHACVQHFVSTYGFIPQAPKEIFEIKLSRDQINQYINLIQETVDIRYDLIMKWLEILPTIQIIKHHDKVGINVNFNPIPFWFIFSEKFEYIGWESQLSHIEINDEDLQFTTVTELSNFINFQETNCDVIQGIEKVAIKPNHINDLNEQDCRTKFHQFLKLLCKHISINNEADLTGQYLEYKNDLFKALVNQDVLEVIDSVEEGFYQPKTIYS